MKNQTSPSLQLTREPRGQMGRRRLRRRVTLPIRPVGRAKVGVWRSGPGSSQGSLQGKPSRAQLCSQDGLCSRAGRPRADHCVAPGSHLPGSASSWRVCGQGLLRAWKETGTYKGSATLTVVTAVGASCPSRVDREGGQTRGREEVAECRKGRQLPPE